MKIALTGHRPDRIKYRELEIQAWISNILSNEKYTEAYSGMANGSDLLFAEEVIKMNIPLICCFPFSKQYFNGTEQLIMSRASDVRFISDRYSKQSYWIRNKYMVDHCDALLAVWDGLESGGTWNTISYARKIGKPIIYFPC